MYVEDKYEFLLNQKVRQFMKTNNIDPLNYDIGFAFKEGFKACEGSTEKHQKVGELLAQIYNLKKEVKHFKELNRLLVHKNKTKEIEIENLRDIIIKKG